MKNELNAPRLPAAMALQPPPTITSGETSTVWYTAAPLFETALARGNATVLILMERLMAELKGRKLKENKRRNVQISRLPRKPAKIYSPRDIFGSIQLILYLNLSFSTNLQRASFERNVREERSIEPRDY